MFALQCGPVVGCSGISWSNDRHLTQHAHLSIAVGGLRRFVKLVTKLEKTVVWPGYCAMLLWSSTGSVQQSVWHRGHVFGASSKGPWKTVGPSTTGTLSARGGARNM